MILAISQSAINHHREFLVIDNCNIIRSLWEELSVLSVNLCRLPYAPTISNRVPNFVLVSCQLQINFFKKGIKGLRVYVYAMLAPAKEKSNRIKSPYSASNFQDDKLPIFVEKVDYRPK